MERDDFKIPYRDYMNVHIKYNLSHFPKCSDPKYFRIFINGSQLSSPQADIEKVHSFTRHQFNFGYPFQTGASALDKSVINNEWDSTQEPKEFSSENKYNPAFYKLRMDIGGKEDQLTDIDIRYSRNQRIFRQFYSGFNFVVFNEVLAEELEAIYHNRGHYMLQLLKQYPKIVFPIVYKRIDERRKELFIEKFENQIAMGKEFETIVPALRAMCTFDPIAFPEKLGPFRIFTFQNQAIFILKRYLNVLANSMSSDNNYIERKTFAFQSIITCLTKQGYYTVKYQIAILISLISSLITEIIKIDFIDNNPNTIDNAVKLGITEISNHRYAVIFKFFKDISSLKEKNDIIYKIGGFMKNVDLKKASLIATLAFSIQYFFQEYIKSTKDNNYIINITNKTIYQGFTIIFNQDMKVSVPEILLAHRKK